MSIMVRALLAFGTFAFASIAAADGSGWYLSSQIAKGSFEYSQKCAVCHGQQLQGGGAPPLKGKPFVEQWNGKTLAELYQYVHGNMPLGVGASLPSQEYADIVAYILAQNGLPPGNMQFTPRTPMERVLALGGAPASAAPGTGSGIHLGALVGSVVQPTSAGPSQAELDAADDATTNWLNLPSLDLPAPTG